MFAWFKDFFTVQDVFKQAATAAAGGLLNVAAQGGMPQDMSGWVLVAAATLAGGSAPGLHKAVKKTGSSRPSGN